MHNPHGTGGPIRSEFAGDADMAELVVEFVEHLPDRIEQLSACLESGDSATLTRVAHQLSGSCGGYGFSGIGDVARALETRLKACDPADDLSAVRDQVQELVDLCRRVVI